MYGRPRTDLDVKRCCALLLLLPFLFAPSVANAYSVLSHEEVVDMAWKDQIVPLLKARYPAMTPDDLRVAHAYAYGGSVIQDIGYYPFGSHYFSDLLHYVRPNEFVMALIRDSKTPDEYAFALGALAHFCGDTIGHPIINQITSLENPPLRRRFGQTVTYAEDPTAHLRTEFGFDVVEVAQGHYSQQDYHDFVGFQVAKPLLEQAFHETYGLQVSDIIKHEDLAISMYRRAVSNLIPRFTAIAFVSYRDQIQKAEPGMEKTKFVYRLNKTEYRLEFGTQHMHVGFGGRVVAFLMHAVPKVGPFKALKLKLPNPQEQDLCLKSVNRAVDQYKIYLAQISAQPMPVPPPNAQDVAAAKDAAAKVAKDATQLAKAADKADDPEDKAKKEDAAVKVSRTADKAQATAERTEMKAAVATPEQVQAVATAAAVTPPPVTPNLPELDMDTGKPAGAGEYPLADEAYARLLEDLVSQKAAGASASGSAQVVPAVLATREVSAGLAEDIEHFFAHPLPPAGIPASGKELAKQEAATRQVQVNLVKLRGMEGAAAKSLVALTR